MSALARWKNGGYEVALYSDGTKIRRVIDATIPPQLPEQMDLKITDWCDAGCAWCHEKSTLRGKHGDLDAAIVLLNNMPSGTEIAIGGGDPLSHPDFARFVRAIREKGLIPSVTVNGRHLARHRALLDTLTQEGSLFGVGVSMYDQIPDWDYEHMVVHMIAGVDNPALLDGLDRRLKILLLGYKRHGRGIKWASGEREKGVEANIQHWRRALFWLARSHHLSFDTLGIEQLEPQRLFQDQETFERHHMGDEGTFSMYVDAVTQTYGVSSYAGLRLPWTNMEDMFGQIRALRPEKASDLLR